jgi:hypothetical protein
MATLEESMACFQDEPRVEEKIIDGNRHCSYDNESLNLSEYSSGTSNFESGNCN